MQQSAPERRILNMEVGDTVLVKRLNEKGMIIKIAPRKEEQFYVVRLEKDLDLFLGSEEELEKETV